ncbi:hypothetical protein, partial [Burkholderia sp. SIMBA_019]|uniref:hypothetical protein n=1 Tax=Burkholderia sp. SIMBA_019 TaxID=3085765 RepID=UPI00397ADC93
GDSGRGKNTARRFRKPDRLHETWQRLFWLDKLDDASIDSNESARWIFSLKLQLKGSQALYDCVDAQSALVGLESGG